MSEPLFKKTRFDVEQEIMEIGSFADMLKSYADGIYDGECTPKSTDDIHTTLHGMANLILAHTDKMLDTHKRVFRLDEYREEA